MRIKPQILVPVAMAALLACGPKLEQPNTQPPPDEHAPEFEGGGQEAPQGEQVYPGPYGIGVGSVIANYKFLGFPRADQDKSELREIFLADFYNPTGTEVYPAGSPFGEGQPKPLALVLDRSAVWCGPCQYEASQVIPARRQMYAPQGEFFVTLDDGADPGTPATPDELRGWTTAYNVNYPAVIDPNSTLSAIVGRDAYPGNVIVRTRDMKIVHWHAGTPGNDFWDIFEKVIANEPIPGVD